jgi:hypothetical protein
MALQNNKESSWRTEGFVGQGAEATFGTGKLSISVGRFMIGHTVSRGKFPEEAHPYICQRLIDPIQPSAILQSPIVQQWLDQIRPAEQFLNAVLHIVHLELWTANCSATKKLVERLPSPSFSWPTVYSGMDVIVNRLTPAHLDGGGAFSFYDHLLSLGQGHMATLNLDDLDAQFSYDPGTSIFLTGKVLTHSVPQWLEGERVAIAHYSKDDVHDRLGIPRPALPTQSGWWASYGSTF